VADEAWFVRLARRGTEPLGADHCNECVVLDLVSAAGLAPAVVRCDPARKLLVTHWIEAMAPADPCGHGEPDYLHALADAVARLHALAVPGDLRRVDFARRAQALEQEVGAASSQWRQAAEELRRVGDQLFHELERGQPRLVLCHNDLNPANIVTDRRGRPWLVDWEYAGLGDPAFDLASCISQHELAPAQCEAFLARYRAAGGLLDRNRFVLALWGFDYVQWLWYRAFHVAADHSERILAERRAGALSQSLRERASSLPHCNN
jgi:thiamine kinase